MYSKRHDGDRDDCRIKNELPTGRTSCICMETDGEECQPKKKEGGSEDDHPLIESFPLCKI